MESNQGPFLINGMLLPRQKSKGWKKDCIRKLTNALHLGARVRIDLLSFQRLSVTNKICSVRFTPPKQRIFSKVKEQLALVYHMKWVLLKPVETRRPNPGIMLARSSIVSLWFQRLWSRYTSNYHAINTTVATEYGLESGNKMQI